MSTRRPLISIGEGLAILANVGVVIGLIFVWMEIRQSQTQLKADVELSLASSYQTVLGRSVDNPAVADLLATAYMRPDELSSTQYLQLMAYHAEWMALVFATYQLWTTGAIDIDVWHQHSQYYLLFLTTPWMQDFWRGLNHDELYPEEFLNELEARLPHPQAMPRRE